MMIFILETASYTVHKYIKKCIYTVLQKLFGYPKHFINKDCTKTDLCVLLLTGKYF